MTMATTFKVVVLVGVDMTRLMEVWVNVLVTVTTGAHITRPWIVGQARLLNFRAL